METGKGKLRRDSRKLVICTWLSPCKRDKAREPTTWSYKWAGLDAAVYPPHCVPSHAFVLCRCPVCLPHLYQLSKVHACFILACMALIVRTRFDCDIWQMGIVTGTSTRTTVPPVLRT